MIDPNVSIGQDRLVRPMLSDYCSNLKPIKKSKEQRVFLRTFLEKIEKRFNYTYLQRIQTFQGNGIEHRIVTNVQVQ